METGSSIAWLMAVTGTMSACGPAPDRTPQAVALNRVMPAAVPATVAHAAQRAGPRTPRSCAAAIGAAAAAKRVAICRDMSPATHPPCDAANSCAMIDGEIARSCALFDDAGCTPAPKSVAAAADVVRRYYSAIDARDYPTAWTLWGDNGRPGQAYAAFAAGFAHTRSTRVAIGKLPPGDAGVGSIYQPVPVTVDATSADGTRQRFVGSYVVRRINDVDGATAAQLRWHLDSAALRRVPLD